MFKNNPDRYKWYIVFKLASHGRKSVDNILK